MSAGYVNIGRTDDPAYRYKMPRVVGKVEGRGNGIKTVIVNIMDLGLALHREPEEVCKFMGCELGAQTTFNVEQEKAIVNGAHKDDVLQELVNLYVDKFVLCPTCKYPETSYKFKLKNQEIYHLCKACGANDLIIDETHKLCKFILNKEKQKSIGKGGKKNRKERKAKAAAAAAADASPSSPDSPSADKADKAAKKAAKKAKKEAKKEKKRKKKEKKKEKKKKKKKSKGNDSGSDSSSNSKKSGDDDDDDEVWTEGKPAIVQDTTINTSSPAEAMKLSAKDLAEFIAEGKETRQVIDKLGTLQVNYKLQPADRCGILFTAVFGVCKAGKDVLNSFTRFKSIFRQLLTGTDIELFASVDRHFTNPVYASQLALVPLILQLFYNEDLIKEVSLQKWFTASDPVEDRHGMVEVGSLDAVKAKAKKFVDGLEEESDSDSSSSDSD